jgi:hypothetical protein
LVVVDFDKKSWKADACAFLKICHETGVPASLERSRSGNGGHVWIFFANPVQAALARKLASAILTRMQTLLRNVYPGGDVINVRHVTTDYDVDNDPWLLPPSGRVVDKPITEPLPPNISITLGNLIYVEKKELSDVFLNRLMRLAAFQNPEFYRGRSDAAFDFWQTQSHRLR